MQFVDEATIEVAAGDGGYGLISFRREAKVPLGGPDGGQGGDGGDVVLEASDGVVTLLDHRYKRHYRAEVGKPGGTSNKTGRRGEDAVVPVPVGTIVTDVATGEVLADLREAGQRVVVAKGGRGGRGNSSFATSTRQTPRYSQEGLPGEARELALSLKLVADVGLVGLPNAGKSTFIRAVTRSQARVGAYPFTTLVPNLGVYRLGERDIVVADVPGLIEGAHEGQGLGDKFLKHLERTQVLVHLVSLSPDAIDPVKAYQVVRGELSEWSRELARMPEIVVLNKVDLIGERAELDLWRTEFEAIGVTVMTSSGLSGEHVHDVMRRAVELLAPKEDPDAGGWSPL
ncbi:MAG: GTPase ObgE [Myxococcales bacterium]|nr:GTPase ObgE [Myxococcales bacterium]MCB9734523.1 GTPase ObgE [Deltaproteobacteria bacterium]